MSVCSVWVWGFQVKNEQYRGVLSENAPNIKKKRFAISVTYPSITWEGKQILGEKGSSLTTISEKYRVIWFL